MSLLFGITVYKEGLQDLQVKDLPRQFVLALILSSILAIFSGYSHTHYSAFLGLIK